jgi:hypothetical protein
MESFGNDQIGNRELEELVAGGEVLLWADAVHERLESMQLYFWRLAFSPRYPKKKVFEGLAHFYGQARITSYVVYETLGDFDLLLRVWAPRTYNAEELELLLRQSLEGCYLWNLNYLACKTELHFSENGNDSRRARDEALEAAGVPVIDAVNQYNEQQWLRHTGANEEADAPAARSAEVDELIERGTLRAVPLDTRGIRMFITFDHPRQPFRPETRAWVVKDIRKKCEEVCLSWEGRTERLGTGQEVEIPFPNISIYAGAGSMTDFLVMVRAPHKHFHAFVHDLIFGIRDIGLDEKYEMRPYTHVIADRMFSEFREYRVVGGEAGDLSRLIQKDEDEALELKATLATNFRSLVAADRHEADPAMLDEVVKAVCGLLNSPSGGTLIIGVLEVKREIEKVRDSASYLDLLEERFGYSPLDDEGNRTFPNAVVGIEVDLDPGPLSDQDRYERHLRDALKSRISPSPWPWLRVEFAEIGGKTICLVWVRPGDVWFYAKTTDSVREEFFVREGASTPALSGTEGDLYKQVYPRGLPISNGHSEQA